MRLLFAATLLCVAGLSGAQDRIFRDGFERPCGDLEQPFTGAIVQPYANWYGVPFGTNHSWVWGNTDNGYVAGSLSYIRVRSYSFEAPAAGQARRISFPSSTGGIAASVSRRCGDFDVPVQCLGVASTSVAWSTEAAPAAFRCPLIPGETYYLNFAWFDLPAYLSGSRLQSTCECPGVNCSCSGSNCTAVCQYGNNSTP